MAHHDPMKLPPLDPTDPASLDVLLTDDEKAIRTAVRQMLDASAEPHLAEWFEKARSQAFDSFVVGPAPFSLLTTLYTGASAAGDMVFTVPASDVAEGTLAVTPDMFGDKVFVAVQDERGEQRDEHEEQDPRRFCPAIECFVAEKICQHQEERDERGDEDRR